jgi:transcription elongation factor Elf1
MMYECFHCGERAVVWQNDYSFEDYGIEGEGIIHDLRCSNCGAAITYEIKEDDDE